MAHSFEDAVALVLDIEGGALTNDKYDPGGKTKYGIAQTYHPDIDVANLTRDDAIAIYRNEYWARAGCPRMPWAWALAVFDSAVNQGVGTAIHFAQRALGQTQDGVVGAHTLAAMAAQGWQDKLADFMALRCVGYAENVNAQRYEHGWFKRCFVVQAAALT